MQLTILGGAGIRSPIFTYSLLYRDWPVRFDRLVLYDVDEQRLAVIGQLNQLQAQQAPVPIDIVLSHDLQEAVTGADYIFVAIRVGQEAGRVIDETTAWRHGVLGQETTGAGGFAMALRTVPVLVDYGRVIQQHAPEAWLLNFSNPVGITTQALVDHTRCRVIGICDTPESMGRRLARFLQVPLARLSTQYLGLNHLGWMTGVEVDGIDQMPDLLRRYEQLAAREEGFALFEAALVRTLGVLPNDYLFYYYYRQLAEERMRAAQETRGQLIHRVNENLLADLAPSVRAGNLEAAVKTYVRAMDERHATYLQWELSGDTRHRAPERINLDQTMGHMSGYEALAMSVAAAIEQDSNAILPVDVANGEASEDLHPLDVVEVSSRVGKSGPVPLSGARLPASARALLRLMKDYEKATAEAAMTGNRQLAVEALMMNPLVGSFPKAKALVEDYLARHRESLPAFQ